MRRASNLNARSVYGSKGQSPGFPGRNHGRLEIRWYARKEAYGEFLGEDFRIRRYVDRKLNRKPPFAAVSDILIERTREEVTHYAAHRAAGPGHRAQGR